MDLDLKMKKGLVLKGGGVFGLMYIGALKELKACGFKGEYFVGTSIGSIMALLLACNIAIEDIEKEFVQLNMVECVDKVSYWTGMYRLLMNFGWHSTNKFKTQIQQIIKKYVGCTDLTFISLYEKFGNNLAIASFSLETGKTVIFDKETYPTKSVIEACINSCTVPFFFKCENYLDGGLLDNYPIQYLESKIGKEATLGLFLKSFPSHYQRPTSFYNFITMILDLFYTRALRIDFNEKHDTIPIQITLQTSFLDLNLTQIQKSQLIKDGQLAVKQALIKNL